MWCNKQLFVLVLLTTGLVLTGCLVTAQSNDISYYTAAQEQMYRKMEPLAILIQQDDKRLNRLDNTLKLLGESVKCGAVMTCPTITSVIITPGGTPPAGSKDITNEIDKLKALIKSHDTSTKDLIENTTKNLDSLNSKVEDLSNVTKAINALLAKHDSAIKDLEESTKKAFKEARDRENKSVLETNSKIESLADSTKKILDLLKNADFGKKPIVELPPKPAREVNFTLFTDSKKDWYEAFVDCRNRGLDLASIETEQEYNKVIGLIRALGTSQKDTSFWVSASDLVENNKFVWLSTGKNVTYSKWCPSEPNKLAHHDTNEPEHCMELRHDCEYGMNDEVCSYKNYYICDDRTIRDKPNTISSVKPEKKKKIFTVVTEHKTSWYAAFVECMNKGLSLATIENEEEQQTVASIIQSKVGKVGFETNFWLSGSDLENTGKFVWMTTGKQLGYTAWYKGGGEGAVVQPDNGKFPDGVVEHCLSVRGIDHKWNDLYCSHQYYYICDNQI